MKTTLSFAFCFIFVFESFCQNRLISGTKYPFLSEIIKIKGDTSDFFIEVTPFDTTINLAAEPPILDQELICNYLIYSLNSFRRKYGKKPLQLSIEISENLRYVFEEKASITGLTWSTYATFSDYNYVQNTKSKEARFCDFLMDIMSVTSELFLELISEHVKEAGFYFKENLEDHTYEYAIYLR